MVAQEPQKTKFPAFRPGDTIKVHIKVQEGDSERIQIFEGTVISCRGSGDSKSFTVRKISFGVGVERTFPLFSPFIAQIEIVRSARVRRAKLFYLRELSGRAARLTEEDNKAPQAQAKSVPPASAPAKPAPRAASSEAPGKAPDARALASS